MRIYLTAISFLWATVTLPQTHAQVPKGYFTDVQNISAGLPFQYEYDPVMSPDGLSLFFANNEDIWVATRADTDDEFDDARPVAALNTNNRDELGDISPDGLTIYFCNRAHGWELYEATRESVHDDFSKEAVRSLGEGVNTEMIEHAPTVTADGLTLFYYRRGCDTCSSELWMATRDSPDEEFGNARPLDVTVNEWYEWWPSTSADGLVVFYSDYRTWAGVAPRSGGFGGEDIWVTMRASLDDEFETPINLNEIWEGTAINTSELEATPYISRDWPADGSKLYYMAGIVNVSMDLFEATWRIETLGDLSGDGIIKAEDIDLLTRAIQQGSLNRAFDFDGSKSLDMEDQRVLVKDLAHTYFGDADLDGEFNASDMTQVFAAGKYETGEEAGWAEGNWNIDCVFNSSDMVAAFAGGGYEKGPQMAPAAVPEPTTVLLLIPGLIAVAVFRRRLWS